MESEIDVQALTAKMELVEFHLENTQKVLEKERN